MNLKDAVTIQASSGFKGRKPGSKKPKNPDKMLDRAKTMWGEAPDFDLELSREIRSECPHMKAMTYGGMTRTQRMNVAGRMYSKAQTRVRVTRMKAKKQVHAGGPGSGCHGSNCGRPAGHEGPHGKGTHEDLLKQHGFVHNESIAGIKIYKKGKTEVSVHKAGFTLRDRTHGTKTGTSIDDLKQHLSKLGMTDVRDKAQERSHVLHSTGKRRTLTPEDREWID